MRSFLFVVSSTRADGNTERLARIAARSLPATDAQTWLRLADYPLEPFADTRHSTGYVAPTGNAKLLCDATLAATDLVIVAPVYWYGFPWPLALYLDHWSAWMRIKELAFMDTMTGRALHAVVVDSDDEKGGLVPAADRFAAPHGDLHEHDVARRPHRARQSPRRRRDRCRRARRSDELLHVIGRLLLRRAVERTAADHD